MDYKEYEESKELTFKAEYVDPKKH